MTTTISWTEGKCPLPYFQFTWIAAGVLTLVFCIIWPIMTIPAGVFSLGYFYWFVILSLCWGLVRALSLLLSPHKCPHMLAAYLASLLPLPNTACMHACTLCCS